MQAHSGIHSLLPLKTQFQTICWGFTLGIKLISVFLSMCLFYKLSFVNIAVTLLFLLLPLFSF